MFRLLIFISLLAAKLTFSSEPISLDHLTDEEIDRKYRITVPPGPEDMELAELPNGPDSRQLFISSTQHIGKKPTADE